MKKSIFPGGAERKAKSRAASGAGKTAVSTALGAAAGLAAAAVMMLPVSLLILKEILSPDAIPAAAMVITFISGAVAAAGASRGYQGGILPRCAAAGIGVYVLMLAAGLIFFRESGYEWSVAPGLLAIAGGVLAAVIKSMPKKRRRP